jgi:competence protein ComEC
MKALQTQWRINLGLLPITAVFFHRINWLGFLVNLWAVPWFSLAVMPFVLAGLALMWLIPNLAWELFYIGHVCLLVLWYGLEAMTSMAGLNMTIPHLPTWCIISVILGVAWLLSRVSIKSKPLAMLLMLPVLLPGHSNLQHGQFELDLLDVGQGLSAVVITKHHTLVYDTGPKFSTGFNTGQAVVVPYLTYRDRLAVDTLIISHGDSDHIGGSVPVLEKTEVGEILTSVPSRFYQQDHVARCKQGQSWYWDGVLFKVLAPKGKSKGNNDGSCVLKIGQGRNSAIIPGDIEKDGEQSLVDDTGNQLEAGVLVAPHHGSNTSSTTPFIHHVKPEWVLFPTGFLNRFGFPKSAVVDRYANIASNKANTADAGRIKVLWDKQNWHVSLFRNHGRFWWL